MNNTLENKNKKGLGKGLGSLLGEATASTGLNTGATNESLKKDNKFLQNSSEAKENIKEVIKEVVKEKVVVVEQKIEDDKRIWQIAIDKCVPGQYQPRKKFDKESLQELAQSIKENGILQPIVVRKRAAGGYEIIAGERRWRAAQMAGLHEVSALLRNYNDQETLQMALIENIQREDLDPIEEAESYQRLIEEFNLSQQQAAEKVGKERSTVANSLRLLALPHDIKNMITDKFLTTGHAKVLLAVESKQEQIKLAKQVIEKSLSVRALEQIVKGNIKNKKEEVVESVMEVNLSEKLAHELAANIQKKLGTKVSINYKHGKGDITIQFYSDEQLNTIYDRLN